MAEQRNNTSWLVGSWIDICCPSNLVGPLDCYSMPAGYTLWVLRHRSSKDECIAIDDYQLEVVRKEDRLIRNAETRQKAAAI